MLSSNSSSQLKIIRDIASACGRSGMAGGQILDLSAVGRQISHNELTNMHRLKTGALIKVSATSAARFAGANTDLTSKLAQFGECVGLAFQIHDDILDVTGSQEKTGKSMQKDAGLEKATFPTVLGLEQSRDNAYDLTQKALAELEGFPGDSSALRWLASFAVNRDN
jgi:geranylgeranyl diphosphate synthase type II